jgi:hypothetical protein
VKIEELKVSAYDIKVALEVHCIKDFFMTEVYSRVVGYLRPVAQWNKGKKSEWADRLDFTAPKGEAIAQHQH